MHILAYNFIALPLLTFTILFSYNGSVVSQVIAVGGGNEDQFLPILVEKAGGKTANIYIVAAALIDEVDQKQTINSYRSDFIKLGVPPENITGDIITDKSTANSDVVAIHVEKATAFCVAGGDQHTLVERLYNTKLHKCILKKVAEGHLYYGNSAGTAAIGDLMIADDQQGKIIVEKGLAIVPGMVFEQHFRERKRAWRLKQFTDKYPAYKTVGINEQSAIIIHDGQQERIGPKEIASK